MGYEKRYKEALRRANEYHFDGAKQCIIDTLEYIFPELKESEDEKIRKEIIEYFKQFDNEELRGVDISDWIFWLEKQGEQKPVDFKAKDWYVSKVDGKIHNMTYNPNKGLVWSEEDEEKLNQLHKLIVEKSYWDYDVDTKDGTLYGKYATLDNWLKSLKERMKGGISYE